MRYICTRVMCQRKEISTSMPRSVRYPERNMRNPSRRRSKHARWSTSGSVVQCFKRNTIDFSARYRKSKFQFSKAGPLRFEYYAQWNNHKQKLNAVDYWTVVEQCHSFCLKLANYRYTQNRMDVPGKTVSTWEFRQILLHDMTELFQTSGSLHEIFLFWLSGKSFQIFKHLDLTRTGSGSLGTNLVLVKSERFENKNWLSAVLFSPCLRMQTRAFNM